MSFHGVLKDRRKGNLLFPFLMYVARWRELLAKPGFSSTKSVDIDACGRNIVMKERMVQSEKVQVYMALCEGDVSGRVI